MSEKLIFLSHITEEKALSKIIKDAIEDEFSGFVSVFVSSDDETIKAGQNFVKVIEKGLVDCIAAIFLISPISAQRRWINFELGAVWMRNILNQEEGNKEILILPFCHSEMTVNSLPQPICNLNAIEINLASKLEFAFKSLQSAVGGRGKLKTDFNTLAEKIQTFEIKYTLLDKVGELLNLMGYDEKQEELIKDITNTSDRQFTILTKISEVKNDRILNIIKNNLSHYVSYELMKYTFMCGIQDVGKVYEYEVTFQTSILKKLFKLS